ncbi:transcriptional repressor [Corynebacterium sp. HMSC08F01]|uniref:Fur family transcriptional regulator n=2 Tax=Corynebacterium TaxID=1716 RepID=UPI0008A1D8F7|nr:MULTISPECIES: Fur family transcriptional regulator [Corynebacterium]OFT27770.1 transcriptional repressor [Corynebacterium sp. HMSC08F01]OHO31370.1 transcriptional repressor [Corynebacterium sp. HMSC034B08]OHQ55969.1 transcriptional repressor [Corynebacterium sp. HMSC070H05]MDK8823332.1 Fur family transcriptional regulator [Corynebacterium coyleae]OFL18313.1 transcriptional repressor [Corynebacterium sp. HMSC067D03]
MKHRPHSTRPVPKLGPRMTKQRAAVVDTLRGLDKFASAQAIHEILTEQGESVGLTTVYRTLQSLADVDAVDVLYSPEGETLYRDCLADHHHHHLLCSKCGRSEEIEGGPVERWAEVMAKHYGYELVGHDAEIYGVCRDCQAKR